MSDYRASKGEREHYTSFEECAKAWGCKKVNKKTDDNKKLKTQQEKFCARHICRNCKQPMQYIGGNLMACKNEKCQGIKCETKNEETNEVHTWYIPSYCLLDEKGAEIGNNLFS